MCHTSGVAVLLAKGDSASSHFLVMHLYTSCIQQVLDEKKAHAF
jgi:hypothetical protein